MNYLLILQEKSINYVGIYRYNRSIDGRGRGFKRDGVSHWRNELLGATIAFSSSTESASA